MSNIVRCMKVNNNVGFNQNPFVICYHEDILKININADDYNRIFYENTFYYISNRGIFLGLKIFKNHLKQYNIVLNEEQNLIENPALGILIEINKFDKKFNDLFENTSDIIKELKKDLDVENEKIRNLELEVHYLKSQSEKKVTIDYEAIKQKNKLLNNEFKRIYKLMKFSNE